MVAPKMPHPLPFSQSEPRRRPPRRDRRAAWSRSTSRCGWGRSRNGWRAPFATTVTSPPVVRSEAVWDAARRCRRALRPARTRRRLHRSRPPRGDAEPSPVRDGAGERQAPRRVHRAHEGARNRHALPSTTWAATIKRRWSRGPARSWTRS